MTPEDALNLCKFAKAACPAQAIDQDTPAAWFVLLSDIRYDDAMAALVNVVRKQPFVAPAEIRTEVKRIRGKRLDAFGPIPNPPAELDGDPAATVAWMKEAKRKVADGEVTTAEQLVIEAPTSPRRALTEGTFRRVDESA